MAFNFTEGIGPMAYPLKMVSKEVVDHMLGWNIPEEHQDLVHEHWRNFPAVSKYWHYCLALIYTMLMITSFTGNGIVIWIFSTSKSLRSASNMFVINLAVFDLMMMLEMPLLIMNSFYQRLVGYQLGCDIYAVLGSLSGIGGAITNAVIAFDRYKTISCPLDGRINRVQAGLLIAFTWFWALPFTVLPALKIWGRYVPEGFLTTCSFDYFTDDQDTKVFVACIFVWSYAIPMSLICYFYSQLFGAVRLHERMLHEQAKKMNVKSLSANKEDAGRSVEIRIAKVAFTIFFLFICAWTPYAFVAMTGAFGDRAFMLTIEGTFLRRRRVSGYSLPSDIVEEGDGWHMRHTRDLVLLAGRWSALSIHTINSLTLELRSLLTPVATMIPAVCCKVVSCIDPWVYAINHPRYRAELEKRIPWLGVREHDPDTVSTTTSMATAQSAAPTTDA